MDCMFRLSNPEMTSTALVALPRTRAEALAARMEEEILRTGMAPGDWVGTLDEIRAQTGLARATVSEAVRLLRERGILEIRPGRGGGLFIAPPNPVVRLRHTLLTVRDAPATVLDAIALREALEELINRDAARHRSQTDIADLKRLLSGLQRALKTPEAFMRANWALHERIADIGPNVMASAVYKGTLGYLSSSSAEFRSDDPAAEGYWRGRYRIHEALVRAIINGNENAVVQAVRQHNTAG
jgi:DNA-binding FadR family transcriptional regulator